MRFISDKRLIVNSAESISLFPLELIQLVGFFTRLWFEDEFFSVELFTLRESDVDTKNNNVIIQ